ncbi:MAG: peptidase, partial [Candidatus Baltobacteraceae bacterium]
RAGMLRGLTYFRIAQDLDHLRACLAQGYAFVFGMQAYEQGFSAAQHSGHLPMPGPHDTLVGGHAVLAVGYDDASRTFTALNSLGKTFGDAGYFTLPYAFLTDPKLAYDFWTIRTLK